MHSISAFADKVNPKESDRIPSMPITALHHVQLAMPRGREEEARAFYAGTLGMTEVPKPENLAK